MNIASSNHILENWMLESYEEVLKDSCGGYKEDLTIPF